MADNKVYLLLGPEEGEKAQFVAQLQKDIESRFGEDPETHKIYPFDTQISDVVSMLKNGSLFAAHRLVILAHVEEIKQNDAQTLAGYIKAPSDDVTLVLLSTVTGTSQLSSHIGKAVKKEQTRIFWEMFENRKQEWIVSFFRTRKIRIETEAVLLLLDLVENNTQDMKTECEGLAAYYGEGRELSTDDIEAFVSHSRQESVFTLFGKIAQRDLPGALEILARILLSGDGTPVSILGGLVFQFRRLLVLSRHIDSHQRESDALSAAEIRGKKNGEMYLKAKRAYSSDQIEQIICLIADCDSELRSAAAGIHRILLETFLYSVIKKQGKPVVAET